MKKLILGIALFGGLSAANAQIDLGVKGGLNFPTLSGAESTKFRTDFYVGGYANYKITDQFSFQPEVLYSKQGAGIKRHDGSKERIVTHNINIPLMARYEIMENLNVEFGPQLGFLVSAQDKYELNNSKTNTAITDNFKTFDFGLNLGAGYKVTDQFEINARITKGLTDINHNPYGKKTTNTYFSVGVAYKLTEM
jgi:hypothetical protein